VANLLKAELSDKQKEYLAERQDLQRVIEEMRKGGTEAANAEVSSSPHLNLLETYRNSTVKYAKIFPRNYELNEISLGFMGKYYENLLASLN